MTKAFVDFYATYNISPVSQDISDLEKHFQRRESLFRALGILPAFVANRTLLEFGPGSGHNALYTASLSPRRYVLVDGNPKGVEETRARLRQFPEEMIEVKLALFDEFKSENKFELVWAEGCLPLQHQPLSVLKYISSFVDRGGLLCVSTSNGISYLSEMVRRLFRDRFFDATGDIFNQVKQIVPCLTPHLNSLQGRSRPIEDWILDNIVQPLQDRQLMSIPNVIETLGDQFDVYSTSPRFLSDWRWYKDITGSTREFNRLALSDYYKNNLNLLDYRFQFASHSVEFGMELEDLGCKAWNIMCRIEHGDDGAWEEFYVLAEDLTRHIEPLAPATSMAIQEAIELLRGCNPYKILSHFPSWWGRGQQYVSLIKN